MHLKTLLIACYLLLPLTACQSPKAQPEASIPAQLSAEQIATISAEIDHINITDQLYRDPISLGTLDDSLLQVDKQLSKTATIEEYIAFQKTVPRTLTKAQEDSLWALQHKIDYENYLSLKAIFQQYGYPSEARLGKYLDIFPILVHPPIEIEPQAYLDEMVAILKPEVAAGRMEGNMFAMFYDNIKAKILREPQLYGTMRSFDPATMSMGNPKIQNIDSTNAARKALGLPNLGIGEYDIVE